jgi:catechol 2,3-dioxygenase-like lactoylglutathione lyase family enzyme
MTSTLTRGVHHVGLAVPDLDGVVQFFIEALGWELVGARPDYPAAFVSDGSITLTLWRVADPENAIAFDRRANIGLHHLALAVADEATLMTVYERVRHHPGVETEFAPEPNRASSSIRHFICAMPGGIRVEFATISG